MNSSHHCLVSDVISVPDPERPHDFYAPKAVYHLIVYWTPQLLHAEAWRAGVSRDKDPSAISLRKELPDDYPDASWSLRAHEEAHKLLARWASAAPRVGQYDPDGAIWRPLGWTAI